MKEHFYIQKGIGKMVDLNGLILVVKDGSFQIITDNNAKWTIIMIQSNC